MTSKASTPPTHASRGSALPTEELYDLLGIQTRDRGLKDALITVAGIFLDKRLGSKRLNALYEFARAEGQSGALARPRS